MATALGLAIAMLALGFLAALGVRSLVVGTATASPQVPNPGHSYSQIELPVGTWPGLDADLLDGMHAGQTGASYIPYADGSGNVGIGTTNPNQKLTVAGTIESTSGGFKFPDGTVQATAAAALRTYDSGWFPVGRNGDYDKTHDLGTTGLIVSLWFSKSSDGSSRCYGPAPLSWREHNPEHVSGVTVAEISTTSVRIRTGNDFRIPSASPGANAYENLSSGYARVIALAVD